MHTYSFTTSQGQLTVEAPTLGDALDLLNGAKLISSIITMDGMSLDIRVAVAG